MTGTELKDLREKAEMTQEQLGMKLGLHRNSIIRYESMQEVPEIISLAIRKLLD